MKTTSKSKVALKRPITPKAGAEEKYAALAVAWKRFSVRILEIHRSLDGYPKR